MREKLIKNEIAKLFNITKAAIRYYEEKGVLCSQEDENGYRLYDWDDIKNLDQIIFLKQLGISIDNIRLYKEEKEDIKSLLDSKKVFIEDEIERLIYMKSRIEDILSLENTNKLQKDVIKIEEIEERTFLTLKESKYYSVKDFYDLVFKIYDKSSFYNENFILLHEDYSKDNCFENSKMLLSYSDNLINDNLYEVVLPKSKYITISYVFREIDDFNRAYSSILDYAEDNNLKINDKCFLELEYKDYSILHKEAMYELQFEILR